MSIFDRITQKSMELGQANQRRQHMLKLQNDLARNAKEDARRFPDEAAAISRLIPKVRDSLKRYQSESTVGALSLVFPEANRMSALVCLLPPANGGDEISREVLQEALDERWITFGLQEEIIAEFVGERKYLHFFPAAYGRPSVDGVDGNVVPIIEAPAPVELEVPEGQTPSFDASLFHPTRPGEILCDIKPAVLGREGANIRGEILSIHHEGEQPPLPMGENTAVSSDGLQLISAANGLLCEKNGQFFVRETMLVNGPIAKRVTTTRIKDMYVIGDVVGGAILTAPGNIIVSGEVRDAELYSANGSIRVCKGIWGGKVHAGKQIQAPILERVILDAGGSVYAEKILDCELDSNGHVIAMGQEGTIAGGSILARKHVVCTKLGDGSGETTTIGVGYTVEDMETLKKVTAELESVLQTVDKLRKSIVGLRRAGETLSLERRALLSQLVEQRTLYEQQAHRLNTQQKLARETMYKGRACSIKCRELHPKVVVHIGDKIEEFKKVETKCNIHISMGQIVSK